MPDLLILLLQNEELIGTMDRGDSDNLPKFISRFIEIQ